MWIFIWRCAQAVLLLLAALIYVTVLTSRAILTDNPTPAWFKALWLIAPLLFVVIKDARERHRDPGKMTETYDLLLSLSTGIEYASRPKNLGWILFLTGGAYLYIPVVWHWLQANANTVNALATSLYTYLTLFLVAIGTISLQASLRAKEQPGDCAEPLGATVDEGSHIRWGRIRDGLLQVGREFARPFAHRARQRSTPSEARDKPPSP